MKKICEFCVRINRLTPRLYPFSFIGEVYGRFFIYSHIGNGQCFIFCPLSGKVNFHSQQSNRPISLFNVFWGAQMTQLKKIFSGNRGASHRYVVGAPVGCFKNKASAHGTSCNKLEINKIKS
jgi:hypothetical protein